ncbi:hypothetical protein, partial [Bacillus pseudomycoides]
MLSVWKTYRSVTCSKMESLQKRLVKYLGHNFERCWNIKR